MKTRRLMTAACMLVVATTTTLEADLLPLEVYGRTGDLIRVDLKAARGGSSFQLGATGFGVADILTSDEVEGLPFSETGRFYVVPGIESAPPISTELLDNRGYQGTLSIPVSIDGQHLDLDVTVRSGYTHTGFNAKTPLTVPTDGSAVAVAAAQQRLNYLGFQKTGGGTLSVDGSLGPNTESSIKLFKAATASSGEVNPGGFSGSLSSSTVSLLNNVRAPRWVELVDPDPQIGTGGGRPGGTPVYDFDPNDIEGDYDILPARDPGTGVRTGRTPQTERYATSWTIDTILAAAEALPGRLINAMSRVDGVGSACCHSTHQAGLDIDVHVEYSTWNYGNGVLSADELGVVEVMRSFVDNTPDDARVWRIIVSNTDIRDEFNRQTGTSIAVGDSSGVHLNHLHIDLRENLPSRTQPPHVESADFDLDGELTLNDIDLFVANLGGDPFYFDLTGDDLVDHSDFNRLVHNEMFITPGDANFDGSVDLLDLSTLASHFNVEDVLWSGGDFNADGRVDLLDLSILAFAFDDEDDSNIPEPRVALALLGILVMCRRPA
ncbi:dockerin type I domain-containing protein [Mucisphaera calidilacus]|uniref:Peptidoglycan binding-like domain-containing protein n=1 Tax=Mucisphaera calidilacus TaxID=2527982 RepID=A0A518BWH3_9BACT|nr:dockerin type I domain-containing protein [Mucisphaera calidilacus]QDU71332.1 hypothetical protein Pan265_11810 [Mucisphaera calidilacus]